MKGIATWMWVIGGIIIATIVMATFFNILARIIVEKHRQDSKESFLSLVNSINSLCEMNRNERYLKTATFSDMVKSVYALGESGAAQNGISYGRHLCMNISGDVSCEKTNCLVEMKSIAGEENLLGLIDRLMARHGYNEYKLELIRTECGVSVLDPGMQGSCLCDFSGAGQIMTCQDNGENPVLLEKDNLVILTDITPWIDKDNEMLKLSKNIANYLGGNRILIVWEDTIVDATFPKTALESNGFHVSLFRHTSALTDLNSYDQIWILNPGWCENPARAGSSYCTGVKTWDDSEINLISNAVRTGKGILLLTDSGVIRGRYETIELKAFNKIISSYGLAFSQIQGCACGCGTPDKVLSAIKPHQLTNGIAEFKVKAVARLSCKDVSGTTTTAMATSSTTTTNTALQKKVFLVIFNPVIESQGNKKLTEVIGWNDPSALSQQFISDIREASGGYVDYIIADTIDVDSIPKKADGFEYSDQTYIECLSDNSKCHNPDGVDYNLILDQYDVCTKLNSGEIDEAWVFGGPWFGYWESAMAGPGAFWINGGPISGTSCNKKLPVMGFNYERGAGEMLESFGHRSEATITHVFGGWDVTQSRNDWDRFGHNKGQTPGVSYYQCGSVHYGPNSLSDYDWSNYDYVQSNCDDWLNYPNFQGTIKQVNCQDWGCEIRGHHKWWLRHIPNADGKTNDVWNNWWRYVVDYDNT